jgi:hypothetical protein
MPLLTVKTSKKIDTQLRLEQSTAKTLDHYAHFLKSSADDVVNEALEYVFARDKDFQQYLQQNPDAAAPSSLRVKKIPPSVLASRKRDKSEPGPVLTAAK